MACRRQCKMVCKSLDHVQVKEPMGRLQHCSRPAGMKFHLRGYFLTRRRRSTMANQRAKLRNSSVSAHFMSSAKWITQEGVLDMAGTYTLDQVLG